MEGFFGTVNLQADEKGRYRIPSKYRNKLGNKEDTLFLMRNGSPYLSIMSAKKSEEIISKLTPLISIFDNENSAKVRAILANMCEIKEDSQGRFTLPQDIREELGFGKEVVFIGMGQKVEMWNKATYDEINNKAMKNLSKENNFPNEIDLTF